MIVFHNFEIVNRNYEIVSHNNEMLSPNYDILSHNHEIVSHNYGLQDPHVFLPVAGWASILSRSFARFIIFSRN